VDGKIDFGRGCCFWPLKSRGKLKVTGDCGLSTRSENGGPKGIVTSRWATRTATY